MLMFSDINFCIKIFSYTIDPLMTATFIFWPKCFLPPNTYLEKQGTKYCQNGQIGYSIWDKTNEAALGGTLDHNILSEGDFCFPESLWLAGNGIHLNVKMAAYMF